MLTSVHVTQVYAFVKTNQTVRTLCCTIGKLYFNKRSKVHPAGVKWRFRERVYMIWMLVVVGDASLQPYSLYFLSHIPRMSNVASELASCGAQGMS